MHKRILLAALAACMTFPLYGAGQTSDWKVLSLYEKAPVKKQLTDRLTQYVKIDTAAKPGAAVPSSAGQLKWAKSLAKELKKNGAVNVKVDKSAVVTAQVPSNVEYPAPVIALIGHLDTPPALAGKTVVPQVHHYKGDNLVIDAVQKLVLTPQTAPQLLRFTGHDIVTASGTPALGADSKAGAAVLLTAVQFLYDHPQVPHGDIKIVFLPDHFNGTGAARLDPKTLGADYAYTLDAGAFGELVNETFTVKSFKAVFEGDRSGDIGQAMKTSFADNVLMASDFHTLLPRYKRPETTADKRGFVWVEDITTHGNRTEVTGQIRAFSPEETDTLTREVSQAFNTVKAMNYKGKNFSLTFADRAQNVRGLLPEKIVQQAEQALRAEEIDPAYTAVRGTTAAAQLSANGLPAVGIFTGYYHSATPLEYADIDMMEASFRTVMRLIELGVKRP